MQGGSQQPADTHQFPIEMFTTAGIISLKACGIIVFRILPWYFRHSGPGQLQIGIEIVTVVAIKPFWCPVLLSSLQNGLKNMSKPLLVGGVKH